MTITKLPSCTRPRQSKRARLHLPHMTADEALTVVALLEKAVEAIRRAHGDEMADRFVPAAAGLETSIPQDDRRDGDQAPDDCGF